MNGQFYKIFILFLFLSTSVYSNNEAIKDYFNSSYRFDIFKNSSKDEKRNNYILQQIAFDNSISFSDLNLNVDYALAVEISKGTDQSYNFKLQIEIIGVNGDVKMKSLDVSDYLYPDLCSFDYRLFNRKTGEDYKSGNFYGKLRNEKVRLAHLVTANAPKEYLELEFSNLNFYFSEKQLENFKSHITFIEKYYASAIILEKIVLNYQNWRPDNDRDFVLNYFKIKELERASNLIKAVGFNVLLPLNENDPANFLDKIEAVSNLQRRLNTLLSESLKAKQLFLPNVISLSSQIVECQQVYVEYLKGTPYSNDPISNALMKIDYPNAWFADILNFFGEGLTKNQKSQLGKYFEQFVIRLRNSHLQMAQDFQIKKEYEKAIIQSDNAGRLTIATTPEGLKRIFDVKSQAITGLYRSYLSVADRAMKVTNVEMARLYMKKASDFYKSNKAFILDSKIVEKPNLNLVDVLLSRAAAHKTNKQYPEASKLLIEAAKLCRDSRAKVKEALVMTELRDVYKLESYRIIELNDSRLLGEYQGDEEGFNKEVERLKEDQIFIMNQLERLDAE